MLSQTGQAEGKRKAAAKAPASSAASGPQVVTYPGSPYRLHQPFPPAGDQPGAIDALVEGVEDGLSFQTLLGVTGSGKTYTMANVIARLGRPALVLAPNKTLAAQLYAEMRDFFPENAVEYFVSYYDYYQPEAYVPQRDLFIEKDSAINEHIEQLRLSATKSLLERRDTVIVGSVSCIYGIGNPADYFEMRLVLRKGDRLAQRDLLKQLVAMQYKRNDTDFARGTFRVRGDTIDVFPSENAELALRIEMFDDEVEMLQLFDPLTGRIRQQIPRFVVYAASHYVTPRATIVRALDTIKAELKDRLAFFHAEGKLVEAQRLEQRTLFDLEMLQELGFCKGIENYSRHLSGARPGEPPPTLIDYLPPDALMFIDESHVTIGQLGGMYRGDRARKDTLVQYGFRLPSALDNRPLTFAEFEDRIGQTVYLSATPGDYEMQRGDGVVEQIIRPTPARWSSRWCVPPAWSTPKSRCDRPPRRSTTCSPRSRPGWPGDIECWSPRSPSAWPRISPTSWPITRCGCATCIPTSTRSSASRSSVTCAWASSMCWWASTCCARGWTSPRCRWWPSWMPTRRASCAPSAA